MYLKININPILAVTMNGIIRQQQSGGGNSAVCHNFVSDTI